MAVEILLFGFKEINQDIFEPEESSGQMPTE